MKQLVLVTASIGLLSLPVISARSVRKGEIKLPAHSMLFLTFKTH